MMNFSLNDVLAMAAARIGMGYRKLRGPEEQGLAASYAPGLSRCVLNLTVLEDEFRVATSGRSGAGVASPPQ